MLFSDHAPLRETFQGKRVAIVGSGPGCLDNAPGLVDSHDVVVRVNNYKSGKAQGFRTDVFYTFFGGSIKKDREELKRDGVRLCMAKCPDAKLMDSEWHRKMNKPHGVDFRYIYRDRRGWWFCPTYVPTLAEFEESFELLGLHIPTTGFSAI
jgi:cation diffusion facilitator CzcD-associated flavoprotein CzcO